MADVMRRIKVPTALYAIHAGRLTQVGSSCVELIEWTHHDGTRTYLAPCNLGR